MLRFIGLADRTLEEGAGAGLPAPVPECLGILNIPEQETQARPFPPSPGVRIANKKRNTMSILSHKVKFCYFAQEMVLKRLMGG